jgi:SRI (Set2 Rpb1 interacting) domain
LLLVANDFANLLLQIADKLANSDFKSGRVEDPTKIDEKHETKVKKYCKEFFDKAAHKHRKLEKEKAARKLKPESSKANGSTVTAHTPPIRNLDASPDSKKEGHSDDEDVKLSEDEDETPTPPTPSARINSDGPKRKREEDDGERMNVESEMSQSPSKRIKSESPLPPPPPPPPSDPVVGSPSLRYGDASAAGINGDGPKRKRDEDDEEEAEVDSDVSKSPAKRMKSESPLAPPPPPPPSEPGLESPSMRYKGSLAAGMNGDSLKRKRNEANEEQVVVDSDVSKSPVKRMKSESPPPPPPPPGPPIDTPPTQAEEMSLNVVENHLHADTSFAEKSMADVLAEAQQDSGDGDDAADVSMEDANDSFVKIAANGTGPFQLGDIGNVKPPSSNSGDGAPATEYDTCMTTSAGPPSERQ